MREGGRLSQLVMASGWISEGWGSNTSIARQRLTKNKNISCFSVPLAIEFTNRTLKRLKNSNCIN